MGLEHLLVQKCEAAVNVRLANLESSTRGGNLAILPANLLAIVTAGLAQLNLSKTTKQKMDWLVKSRIGYPR